MILKITKRIIIALILIYFGMIIYPNFLFKYEKRYDNISMFYSEKNIEVKQVENILNIVKNKISKNKLYDKNLKQYIYICDNYYKYFLFTLINYKTFGVNYIMFGNIFLTKSEINTNKILRNSNNNNVRTLSGVITHEMMHSYIKNKIGFFKYLFLDDWKNEGYCDYVSNESSYNKNNGIKEICNNDLSKNSPSLEYFIYRLYVTYLFDEKKININTFFNTNFDTKELKKWIKQKYCKN